MGKSTGPRCTLTLALKTELWHEHILAKKFRCSERMYNNMARHAKKLVDELKADESYQNLLSEYRACPDTEAGQKLKKQIGMQLNEIIQAYGLSEYDFHDYIAFMKNKSFQGVLDINTAQKIATRVWKATEKVLYSDGKEIHYKSAGDLESLEGKNNKSGIKFNSEFRELRFDNLKIPVVVRKNDTYAELMLTHKICYCRILRKPFKSGWRYYLQLVLEGIPENKPKLGDGNVGIDMGTSTIAAVGDNDGLLVAHGNNMDADKSKNKTVEDYNKEIIKLNRKLEHLRRAANPDNYNEDGTIKKGRKTWIYTKNYYRVKFALKDMYRRRFEFVRQQHCITVNKILKLGNQFTTEPMSWKSLQRRSKTKQDDSSIVNNAAVTDDNKNDDVRVLEMLAVPEFETFTSTASITNNKTQKSKQNKSLTHKKKKSKKGCKRFGKSLNNHSPGLLEQILIMKLAYFGLSLQYVNLSTYRASQYNPETGEYIKCGLDVRFKKIFDRLIQRDLLSAFLLQNPLKDLVSIDTKIVEQKIDNFIKIHDKVIDSVKNVPSLPKCVGI